MGPGEAGLPDQENVFIRYACFPVPLESEEERPLQTSVWLAPDSCVGLTVWASACLPLCAHVIVAFSSFPSNLEASADGSRRNGFILGIFLFEVGAFLFGLVWFSLALE